VPLVNRATGQLFPSAESKSDDEERKKSAAAQRGKNMYLVDSRRLDEERRAGYRVVLFSSRVVVVEQRGSKQKRIQKPKVLPRKGIPLWRGRRVLLNASLSRRTRELCARSRECA